MRGFLLVAGLVERANHIERAFLPLVTLASEDCLAASNGVGICDGAAGHPRESFCHGEWLREEALQAPRSLDDAAVLGAKLLDAEERDHVLKLAVVLDGAANFGSDGGVLYADNKRIEEDRG